MKLIKSVCTNLYFPKSRKDSGEFRNMALFLKDKGIHYMEFYHDGDGRNQIGNILSDTGLKGVYIAVIPSKENKLHLCDENPSGRVKAVQLFKNCIDEAQSNGIYEVLMNSGHIGTNVERGLLAFSESIQDLYAHIDVKKYDMKLLLEPCDSQMDACQLIGPYQRTKEFVKKMRSMGLPMELTMDTAHTVEEGENFLEALSAVKPYCNQIHFANCHIQDKNEPLYGDQHLGFEYPNTEWTFQILTKLFDGLSKLYSGDEVLRIGLEALCRLEDPYQNFENTWNSLKFLHND